MAVTTAADLLRFRLPSFQRRVATALRLVEAWLVTCRRPYVAFSGGKDSLVTLALVQRVAGVAVPAVWSDDELEFPEQAPYVPAACAALGVPLLVVCSHTQHGGWFRSWSDQPYWRAPLPDAIWTGAEYSDRWLAEQGYDGTALGLRRQESARRRTYLTGRHRLYQTVAGAWRCHPLAGWTTDEVYALIAGWALPVNPVYDRLTAIGVPRERQRVGPLPLSPGSELGRGWPDLYAGLVDRYGRRW